MNPPKTASSSGSTWAARTADAYVEFVTRHAKSVVLFFAALTLGSGLLAARLPLRTEFSWLLPDDQPSVIALHKLTQRRPSTAVIEVGIASAEPAATERFAKALAERLRTALPPDLLREVDEDDSLVRRFIWQNRHLYASLADLQRAHEALAARIEKEQAAHHPLLIDFEDKPPSSADNRPLDDLLARMKDAQQRAEGKAGYVGEGGRLRMLVVRFRFGDTEPEKGRIALRILDQTVAALAPAQFHPSLTVGYAGDPVTAALEHDLILGDMVTTTLLCLALVLGLLFVALRSFRSVVILGITLSVGCVLTFGFTWLVIGHLNSSTAFLGSVVAGNGINFGIIHLSRYLEERRRGLSHPVALRLALSRTLVGTLVASTAAATAYASLMITSFRGFSEFGIIAGSGMVFCWLASYSFLPALLHWLETARPLRLALAPNTQDRPASPPALFSRPGLRAALPIGTWLFLLLTSALSLYGTKRLVADPFADDLNSLRSRSLPRTAPGQWSRRLDAAFGRDQSGGFYIGTDHIDQVPELLQAIAAAERGVPPDQRIFGKVDALPNFLPGSQAEQQQKLLLLEKIRAQIAKIEPHLEDNGDDAKLLADLRPPPADSLRPLTAQDLPLPVREAFTEADGRVGLLVSIHPAPAYQVGSYKSTQRAVTLLRSLPVSEGLKRALLISGPEIIIIDMMAAVTADGPRASVLSLALVLVLLLLSFGVSRAFAITAFALFIGSIGMLGLMGLLGIQLNFLSYIAIPITVGIGVDYPFNVMSRLRQDLASKGLLWSGLVQTGGAVLLCSLTTIFGYAVLLTSDTGAIRSFGAAAVLGELTTTAAALLIVPCLVGVWLLRKKR